MTRLAGLFRIVRSRWAWPWQIVRGHASDSECVATSFAIVASAVGLLLTVLSLARHYSFHSSLYDVGIFDQVLWNTSRLRPFESSIKHMNYLGDHFSPSFALLAPLEWLPRSLDLIFAAHAAAVVATAWNVFLLARRHAEPRIAWLVAVGTLFSPALYCPTLSDVHPEPFMAAAIARGLLDLDRGRRWAAALWFALVVAGKEDAALLIAPLGAVLALRKETRLWGLAVSALALAWIVWVMQVAMPAFRPPPKPGAPWFYLGRFSHLGDSPAAIARTLLWHPFQALAASTTPTRLVTLAALLVPFGFAPLRTVRTLAVVPFLAAHYLSLRRYEFFFPFHYLVPVVPVLAWATLDSAPSSLTRRSWRTASAWAVAASAILSVGWRLDPGPLLPRPNHSALREAIARVPNDESVCVENWFGPHLSQRRDIDFCVLWDMERLQYEYYGWPQASSARWQLFDLEEKESRHPGLARRVRLLERAGADVVLGRDGVVLLRVDEAVLSRTPAFVSGESGEAD